MSKAAIIKVSPAGYSDGDLSAVLDIPDVDSSLFTAPTATLTELNALAAVGNFGFLRVKIAGTVYNMLLSTTA